MFKLTLKQIAIGLLVLSVVNVVTDAVVKEPWPADLISTYALVTMAMVAYVGHRVVQELKNKEGRASSDIASKAADPPKTTLAETSGPRA
jgi:hypothetical protein